MNTMVMSILERTREIGDHEGDRRQRRRHPADLPRRGVGDRVLGGVTGVVLGWLVGRVINFGANIYIQQQGGTPGNLFSLPLWLIGGAIGFLDRVSLLAGSYPAARAARLDPIQALAARLTFTGSRTAPALFCLVLAVATWRPGSPQAAAVRGRRRRPMAGLGTHHHRIATTSPEAQRLFDQGLALVYGFNHGQAIRLFQRAAELDPRAPMPLWGIALAYGPNINDFEMDRERAKTADEYREEGAGADRRTPTRASARTSRRWRNGIRAIRPPISRSCRSTTRMRWRRSRRRIPTISMRRRSMPRA